MLDLHTKRVWLAAPALLPAAVLPVRAFGSLALQLRPKITLSLLSFQIVYERFCSSHWEIAPDGRARRSLCVCVRARACVSGVTGATGKGASGRVAVWVCPKYSKEKIYHQRKIRSLLAPPSPIALNLPSHVPRRLVLHTQHPRDQRRARRQSNGAPTPSRTPPPPI